MHLISPTLRSTPPPWRPVLSNIYCQNPRNPCLEKPHTSRRPCHLWLLHRVVDTWGHAAIGCRPDATCWVRSVNLWSFESSQHVSFTSAGNWFQESTTAYTIHNSNRSTAVYLRRAGTRTLTNINQYTTHLVLEFLTSTSNLPSRASQSNSRI